MAGYYTQRRKSPCTLDISNTTYNPNGTVLVDTKEVLTYIQETQSYRTSPGPGSTQTAADILANSKYGSMSVLDNGHEFSTHNIEVFGVNPERRQYVSPANYRIMSPLILNSVATDYRAFAGSPPSPWDVTTRNALGNKAIAQTQPVKPFFSLANFLGEFARDGLPSISMASYTLLMKDKSELFKRAGGEYLNLQFAWTPFIRDLEKMLHVVSDSYQVIEQYKRDSGKVVRRSFRFPLNDVTTINYRSNAADTTPLTGFSQGLGTPYFRSSTSTTRRVVENVYFRGAYSYYIPTDPTFVGQAKYYASLADHLLGIQLTPDVLWNLAPWSWLADWFVNIGDNISVASAFQKDNLVLRYGYLMQKLTDTRTSTTSDIRENRTGFKYVFPGFTQVVRRTSKRRVRAEPYGFGFNTEALSQTQWAILAALGLSGGGEPEWGRSRKR